MKPNARASLNFFAVLSLLLSLVSTAIAQSSSGGAVPFVTIQATEPDRRVPHSARPAGGRDRQSDERRGVHLAGQPC